MKVLLNSFQHNTKSAEKEKTIFPTESVEKANFYKPVLNKIMTPYK